MPQANETIERATTAATEDFLPIAGTDHIEFYVGNAKQAAYFYRAALGFELVAYRGPETGTRESASYVLRQNNIRLVLTTALLPSGDVADHVFRHGDGVKSIALLVDDARNAWHETTARGAISALQPHVVRDDYGEACLSAIRLYGDTVHTFVERRSYRGAFLPGFVPVRTPDPLSRPTALLHIDHMVGNVGWGEMNGWV